MRSVHKVYRCVGTELIGSAEGSLLRAVLIIAVLIQDWVAEHNPSLGTITGSGRFSLFFARSPSDNTCDQGPFNKIQVLKCVFLS